MPPSAARSLDLPEGWLGRARPPRVAVHGQDPAVTMFTDGTTGFSKGVVLTHANYVSSATVCALWGEGSLRMVPVAKRTVMSALPLFHVFGQICWLHYAV